MVDLLLVRRLPPRLPNAGKRLVRSPKVYVRDSGLVHALLGLADKEAVLGHPVAGPSWEGMAIENLLAAAGAGGHQVQGSFYRTSHGAEIDLVLTGPTARSGPSRSSAASRQRPSAAFTPRSPTWQPERALDRLPRNRQLPPDAAGAGDRPGRAMRAGTGTRRKPPPSELARPYMLHSAQRGVDWGSRPVGQQLRCEPSASASQTSREPRRGSSARP